ncbi:MAG: hypothetical protein KJZ74_07315 [Gemmatimonadales bacterium]|nr:hypothetical protein [Gemmatimonadota bacterium]MCL4213706.1 hypothetical protein [Gemmatimonadales bacterium]
MRAVAPCAVLLLSLAAGAMLGAQEQPKPRLDAVRVGGEALGGAYAGIGGFVIGRYVGMEIADMVGVEHDVTRRRAGYAAGMVTGAFATAGAVYLIGSMGDQTGDFNATLLGTGVGYVAAVGIAQMFLDPDGRPRSGMSTRMKWTAINVVALLPAIGATIGFNSTRRIQ